jgi:hypothetical protein
VGRASGQGSPRRGPSLQAEGAAQGQVPGPRPNRKPKGRAGSPLQAKGSAQGTQTLSPTGRIRQPVGTTVTQEGPHHTCPEMLRPGGPGVASGHPTLH